MIKILITLIIGLLAFNLAYGQESGSITVGGDIDKFYPVLWEDGGYTQNKQTELHIGRSSTHANSQWRGSMIAKFYFHTTNWGNGSNFLNAHIVSSQQKFVAGWADPTSGNSLRRMVIWLRGGGTKYYYEANSIVSPIVHDGVQNPLPFVTPNNQSYDHKNSVENYVGQAGTTFSYPLFIRSGKSSFMGNIGIGIANPAEMLEVNGKIRAKEIKLETANWPDYVFDTDYQPMTLEETKDFIAVHGHLPGFMSGEEYETQGVEIMKLNRQLMEKVEELTLHLIQQQEVIGQQQERIEKLENTVGRLSEDGQ